MCPVLERCPASCVTSHCPPKVQGPVVSLSYPGCRYYNYMYAVTLGPIYNVHLEDNA